MWLSEVDATNYVLLISVLIIVGIFALLVFGSLPCSCKYICFLNHCLWRRKNRIRVAADHNNRLEVVVTSAGVPDHPESLAQFPVYPFATEELHPQVHGQCRASRPVRLVHVVDGGRGGLSSLPCYYEYSQNQIKFPPTSSSWEEPPPPYETIFPTTTTPPSTLPDYSEMDHGLFKKTGIPSE